jgi:flavin-binding protein dodecin
MAKSKNDVGSSATSATSATTKILNAPNSYAEAVEFARVWLKAVKDGDATGWQIDFRVAWGDAGRFVSVTIERQFVGFDPVKEVDQAIKALQFDRPIEESKGILLYLLWEKQEELERKIGRPTGRPWAATIWTIGHLFKCSDFPLSRNPTTPAISGFDAIASAMLAEKLAPNSYSGVKANFYDYAKRNGIS